MSQPNDYATIHIRVRDRIHEGDRAMKGSGQAPIQNEVRE